MFDKEKFAPEFYDKLSGSEKKELIRVMLEDQLTDGLHIKGLPKPVQNSIKSAAKLSAKNMKEETMAGYPVEWINGIKSKDEIRNSEIDVLTGCTQNFKTQQKLDMMETLYDILDTEAPDRNGRIWKGEFIKKILNNQIFLISPRGQKTWLWSKLLELQKSYEVKLQKTLGSPLSTKFELKSVIYMRWPKQDLSNLISNLKARDFRYGKMWQDQELINYATGDVSHIDTMILDSLAAFGPDINSGYGMSTPNLNDTDKKKLERVIKRRKKK